MYKFVDRYMKGARIFWSDVRKLQLSCIWAGCNFGEVNVQYRSDHFSVGGFDVCGVLICISAWGICIFAIDVLIETLERSGVFICDEAGCGRLGGRWGFSLK